MVVRYYQRVSVEVERLDSGATESAFVYVRQSDGADPPLETCFGDYTPEHALLYREFD